MRKMRESLCAKIIAWVMISISAVVFMGSCMTAVMMAELGVFHQSFENTRKDAIADVCDKYSVRAIYQMLVQDEETNEAYFADKGFHYGIIQAESLDDINLNDVSVYVEHNFSNTDIESGDFAITNDSSARRDALHTYYMKIYPDSTFYYNEGGILGSDYGFYSENTREWESLYADRICYDTATGIFYYRADEKYYPAQHVTLKYLGTEYVYQYTENGYEIYYLGEDDEYYDEYTLEESEEFEEEEDLEEPITKQKADKLADEQGKQELGKSIAAQEEQETDELAEVQEVDELPEIQGAPTDIAKIRQILVSENFRFSMLEKAGYGIEQWGNIILDDIRSIDATEVTQINSSSLPEEAFPEVIESYLDMNYTLNVLEGSNAGADYWVVSYVDENILNNGYAAHSLFYIAKDIFNGQDNLIPVMNAILEHLYRIRILIFVIIFVSFLIGIGSFGFLLYAAGHRKDKEGIVLTIIDRIPFDIFSIVFLGIEFVACALLASIYYSTAFDIIVCLTIAIFLCMGWTLLLYLLSMAVRVKTKTLLKNTICYKVMAKLAKGILFIWHHLAVLWKTILVMCVVTFLEMILFLFIASDVWDDGPFLFLLLLGKVVVYGVILYVVVMMNKLHIASRKLAEGDLQYHVDTAHMIWEFKQHGENLNSIGIGMTHAVEERMKSERMKTELITNVSHDIKTPLTSIINYVDLLKKEELKNEKAEEYLSVLERQSSRLKKLIEDLVEASKASSGCLAVHMEQIDIGVMMMQIAGEFEDKLNKSSLELVMTKPETAVLVEADGRHLWRVMENLMNNICKYSQPHSRVYLNLEEDEIQIRMIIRNISNYQLNISSDELMERFVRGDQSRNTEGHGLGLSIARSLMELMNGKLNVVIDGDLFKVILEMPRKADTFEVSK